MSNDLVEVAREHMKINNQSSIPTFDVNTSSKDN